VEAPILIKLDFNKPFILDVDWSIKGIGAILSQNLKGKSKSLLMPTRAYFRSSAVFILWREILCSHLGYNAFQAIFSPNFISVMHRSQTFGMATVRYVW
jgi:hypothetical protein